MSRFTLLFASQVKKTSIGTTGFKPGTRCLQDRCANCCTLVSLSSTVVQALHLSDLLAPPNNSHYSNRPLATNYCRECNVFSQTAKLVNIILKKIDFRSFEKFLKMYFLNYRADALTSALWWLPHLPCA